MNQDYPVIVKTYNLTLWYIKKLDTLPKNHRYTLGEKIQNTLLELLLILSDKFTTSSGFPVVLVESVSKTAFTSKG